MCCCNRSLPLGGLVTSPRTFHVANTLGPERRQIAAFSPLSPDGTRFLGNISGTSLRSYEIEYKKNANDPIQFTSLSDFSSVQLLSPALTIFQYPAFPFCLDDPEIATYPSRLTSGSGTGVTAWNIVSGGLPVYEHIFNDANNVLIMCADKNLAYWVDANPSANNALNTIPDPMVVSNIDLQTGAVTTWPSVSHSGQLTGAGFVQGGLLYSLRKSGGSVEVVTINSSGTISSVSNTIAEASTNGTVEVLFDGTYLKWTRRTSGGVSTYYFFDLATGVLSTAARTTGIGITNTLTPDHTLQGTILGNGSWLRDFTWCGNIWWLAQYGLGYLLDPYGTPPGIFVNGTRSNLSGHDTTGFRYFRDATGHAELRKVTSSGLETWWYRRWNNTASTLTDVAQLLSNSCGDVSVPSASTASTAGSSAYRGNTLFVFNGSTWSEE